MDKSMDVQEPSSPKDHGNGNSLLFQHSKLIKSRDQPLFRESACHTASQDLDESIFEGRKKSDFEDNVQNDQTEHDFKPKSQVKAKPRTTFITEKGDILHDNEAVERIWASKKSEGDTPAPDDSKDIFISPSGEIHVGEKAIIAKAIHEIDESCSRANKSFTRILKLPQHKETQLSAQHNDEVDSDKYSRSLAESPCNHSEDNGDKGQHEEQNNYLANSMISSEGCDSIEDDSSISSEIDQQVCLQTEKDYHDDLEDDYDTESSDCHKKLEQNTTHTGKLTEEEYDNMTLDYNNSDTEDDHRSLQQQNSRVTIQINEHTKSKVSSTKEIFEAKKTIASSEVIAASTDCKGINEKVQCLTSDTNIRGGEVRVATAEAKLIDTKVQTGTVVTKVKGAELKLATSDVKGLHAQGGASLNVTTKASTTTAGRMEFTGADVDIQATTEPVAQGASINTASASFTGIQQKAKASVKANISGTKVKAGVADLSVIKVGATAEASAEATGLDVNVGTAQISAVEVSATASASVRAGTALNVANARVTAFDGIGARTSINAQSGVDLLSVNIGVSGNTGVKMSTTTKIGCITVAPGFPKLGFGTGFLNFALGGGVEGQSGTYVGAASAGSSEGSSKHGNGCGGHTSDSGFSSHEDGTGSSTEGNTSGISSVQGSSDVLSGCFSGSVVGMGNAASDSSSIGGNGNLNSGTGHNRQECSMVQENCNVPQSHDNVMEPQKFVASGNFDQPFHLQVLQSLEHDHFGDKKDNAQLHNKQTSVHTNATGPQLSTAEYHVQPNGAGAKLQAMINEQYPFLCGESKSAQNKTVQQCTSVEHVKNVAIRRLNSEGKAGVNSPQPYSCGECVGGSGYESNSILSTKSSNNKRPPKKSKRNSHIHTLDDLLMECPKGIIKLNCGSGGNIAGFTDQDS